MIKHKKNGKTLEEIGKRWYDFDFEFERNIYRYLCYIRKKNDKLQNHKELKFESYQQWNKYVRNKYENFDKDILTEFSRYLNLRIRYISPDHEYWSIMATVGLTVILTITFDKILSTKVSLTGLSGLSAIVAVLILEVSIAIPLISAIVQLMKPIFDSSVDENFLRDYKEIIDELIIEK